MSLRTCMMALTLAAMTSAASAQWGKELKPGSEAPKLDIEKWVQGDPIEQFGDGNVYVVEFWATWCVPCRQAIPILNTVQREFEEDGLVVIGVSTDEKVETVEDYVRRQFGQIKYRIAFDNKSNTKRAWMDAAKQEGIPVTFIVDRKGKLQYIGHPHDPEVVTIIQMVLQGRYDAKLFDDVRENIGAYRQARGVRNYNLAYRHLDEIINHNDHVFARFHFEKFDIMMEDRKSPTEAYAYVRTHMMDRYRSDTHVMIELARKITTDPDIKDEDRDLDLAMEAAKAAVAAARDGEPQALATLALVHFHQGNVSEAISLQRRAWMTATPLRKPALERSLRNYQEAQQRSARLGGN